jgi:hypothetical protein
VTVAHRLPTVVEAGRIVVLAGGRVVRQRPHQQLLADNTVYRELVQGHLLPSATELPNRPHPAPPEDVERLDASDAFDDAAGPEVLAAGADALEMRRRALRGTPGTRRLGP